MKRLYTVLCTCLLASPLYAQLAHPIEVVQSQAYTIPAIQTHSNAAVQSSLDTLTQYFDRAKKLSLYTYQETGNQQIFAMTGSNDQYLYLGDEYDFTGTAEVKGLLVAYAGKVMNGTPDSLTAVIFAAGQTGLPTTGLAQQMFLTSSIDTSSANPVFTPIMFTTAATVNSDFVVMVQTLSLSQTNPPDANFIYSNTQGDGKGEKRACFITVANQQLVAAKLADLFNIGTDPIDIDPMILPILDITSDVKDYPTLNGLTLKGAYPNPAADRTTISIELKQSSDVEVSVVDMSGRVVRTVKQESMSAGPQTVDLNIAGLSAGKYMYTVKTSSAHFGGSLTIVR